MNNRNTHFNQSIATFVLCFFLATTCPAQLKNTLAFYKRDAGTTNGSTKYIIDSLGTFYQIIDSAGKYSVYLGKYDLTGDIISFVYQMPIDFEPILRTEESAAENDSLVKITLLSCLKNPVPAQFEVDAIETNGRFFKAVTLNEKGEIFLNRHKYSSLRLTGLDHYYGKWTFVDIKHLNQTIFLNFPEDFFYTGHPFVWFFPSFSALLKSGGLYDLTGKNILVPVLK